ncbi:MAG: ABC transporter substrate-binding protein [Myxococcota bacterium]
MLLALLACSPAPDATTPATTGAATSSAVPAPAPKKLTVALNWYPEPEFGGFYEAALAGTYAAAGLDVTILPGGPGAPVLELLASGKADVAISGADDLLIRRARGLDAVAVLPGFQDTPVGLMTHTASGVTRFEDVKGKVAIEAGSPFQQFLWGKFGWEGKVEPVPTTGSIGPFAADPTLIQQAFITSEPCVAEGQGLTITFLPGRDAGWNPYASLAVVRGEDKGSAWVKAFHDASLAGWKSYLADPTRGNTEIGRLNPNLPMDRMGCIVARQKPFVEGTDGVGVMTAARWEQTAAALNSVGQKVDAAGAWVDLGG